jgi:hypothetical protein
MPILPGESPEYMRPENEEARHEDGLPTDTETQTSPSVAKRKHKHFGMVPRGLVHTLKRDALNFAEFGLLSFLILSVDHKTGEYVNRLSAIRDECAWEHTDEYLKRCLRRLKAELWIDYDMKRGSRGPYVIRLGERYFAALFHGTDLLPELNPDIQLTYELATPSVQQVTNNSGEVKALSIPDGDGDGNDSRPVPDPSSREGDGRRET